MTEARERRLIAREAIHKIDFQLGQTNRTQADGAPLTNEQYGKWRRNALKARLGYQTELWELKEWIATHNNDSSFLVEVYELLARVDEETRPQTAEELPFFKEKERDVISRLALLVAPLLESGGTVRER